MITKRYMVPYVYNREIVDILGLRMLSEKLKDKYLPQIQRQSPYRNATIWA
jgi:hypothetical protein